MAIIPAGGTLINTTLVTDGVRLNLVNAIEAQLNLAGWTTLSGSGTATVHMRSAFTPNNNACFIRIKDPGGTVNCITFELRDALGTTFSQTMTLVALTAGITYRLILSKYTTYIFTPGAGTPNRQFVCFGTLIVPGFLEGVINGELAWLQGNAAGDAPTGILQSFRTTIVFSNANVRHSHMAGGATIMNTSGSTQTARAWLCVPGWATGDAQFIGWHDQTKLVSDPLYGFGITGSGDWPLLRGQIPSALVLSGIHSTDAVYSIGGRNWYAITESTTYGTLFAEIP